jgi:ribosomal protein S18 acetylase RimI-like enzyme
VEIRGFVEEDRTALRALFPKAGEGSPSGSLWGHPESEAAVYLEPYMDLEPESLLVAVEEGALVGYLAGCVDGSAFPSEDARLAEAVRRYRLVLRPRPLAFFARGLVDVARARVRRQPPAGEVTDPRWPAHLHIDLVPAARGTGAADALMERWLARLREADVRGCHLQTLVENVRAVRFFTRHGFVAYGPTPAVPGLRWRGARVHQQTMVWSSDMGDTGRSEA